MSPYELICEYKREKGIRSDNAAAKELGLTRSAISMIKTGGGFGLETAWKIAETLKMDPAEVIAVCELARAERSEKVEQIQVWRRRLERVTHSHLSIFFASALLGAAKFSEQFCILCQIAPWFRRGQNSRFLLAG